MTDRVNGFTVILSDEIREDDAEEIKKAIEMLKGVLHVDKNIVPAGAGLSEMQARVKIANGISELIPKIINGEF